MEPTRRELREIKRVTKRAGSQHRRRQWKRDLRENPEEAPYSEENFGRFSTAGLNGMDRDKTRVKPEPAAPEPLVQADELHDGSGELTGQE